jgi:hypothetical protein
LRQFFEPLYSINRQWQEFTGHRKTFAIVKLSPLGAR